MGVVTEHAMDPDYDPVLADQVALRIAAAAGLTMSQELAAGTRLRLGPWTASIT
jgi:hypothetical protein